MSRTFNNGVGMVLVVSDVASGEVIKILEEQGETVYQVGKVIDRDGDGCIIKNQDSWTAKDR